MEKIHDLTEKEIKALADASSLIKKMSKYIERVNIDNRCLRRNLEESIKAGDVTNAQKVALRRAEEVERLYEATLKDIKAECLNTRPDCKCEDYKHNGCPIYQKFIVASWMHDAARGNDFGWKAILEYAIVGRKLWMKEHFPNTENLKWK